jgi:hypothetical protein
MRFRGLVLLQCPTNQAVLVVQGVNENELAEIVTVRRRLAPKQSRGRTLFTRVLGAMMPKHWSNSWDKWTVETTRV